MLDIRYIKENPEEVIARAAKKLKDVREDVYRLIELDASRRALIAKGDELKAEQNRASKLIPQMKKNGEDTTEILAKMKEISAAAAAADAELREVEAEYSVTLLGLPNLPDDDLVAGGKEANEPIRYYGEPHRFDFEPKDHVELCESLGLIDYSRSAKLAGNGFWIYKGMGARLGRL